MIDSIAIYFIHGFIILGAVVLFFFAGCRPLDEKNPKTACARPASGAFDATNAFIELKALTAIAPRHSGSPGARKAAEHLLSRLRAAGIQSSLDEFKDETPAGQALFRNVIGVLPGRPGGAWIVVGAHYDTKAGIADNFQGANDSGSGAGVLLELARVIKGGSSLPVNFMFAFFDGEECLRSYQKNDGLHGSRRLVEQLVRDGRAAQVRAVIILDMVGDRDLNITIPHNSALSLVSALFSAAQAEGTRDKFSLWLMPILDDHAPFLSAGMPAIDIIDFEYGSARGKNDYWHTPQDTVDKLSAQSLEIVGKTVLRMLDGLVAAQSGAVQGGKSLE